MKDEYCMTDDEMLTAIAIAKEHWLEISNDTRVWLIPEPDNLDPAIKPEILEHGDYKFVYNLERDELFIGRVDEEGL